MIRTILCYLFNYIYLETSFRIIQKSGMDKGMIISLFSYIALAFFFYVFNDLFRPKTNKKLYFINLTILTFLFMAQSCLQAMYGFYFNFGLLNAVGQVTEFGSDIVKLIIREAFHLLIYAVPMILSILLNKRINFYPIKSNKLGKALGCLAVSFAMVVFCSFVWKEDYRANNTELYVDQIGVVPAFVLDGYRSITKYQPDILSEGDDVIGGEEEIILPKIYVPNVLDIDLDELAENTSKEEIKTIHAYFADQSPTLQNDYTGFFEGKNLVLFLAESFNRLAVREDTTPTLYRLIHEGFYFPNFYSPHIMSTIGGEYQLLTSSIVSNGCLTGFKSGNNSYPFGVGTMFKNNGYTIHAYHNNSYTFQSRDKYIPEMGFENFIACKNGMAEKACKGWPESDIEMIANTVDEFINEDHFMTYYITVSGHGPYAWSGSDNTIAKKYRDIIEELNLGYDEPTSAYLAANIELDRALETLINRLSEADKLDDTVIALVGDHYPYYLEDEEIYDLNGEKINMQLDVNQSYFILYNSAMQPTTVEKVGSQVDVLPTLYNLFNLPYDSRVMIGKDIFSTEPGLAVFDDESWISDYGKYYRKGHEFVPFEGVEVPEDYVKTINKKVQNKINISRMMSQNNYYKYLHLDD